MECLMVSSSHSMKIDTIHRWACICTTRLVCLQDFFVVLPFYLSPFRACCQIFHCISCLSSSILFFLPFIFPLANPFFFLRSCHSFGKMLLEQNFPLAPCTDNPFQFLCAEISQLPGMPCEILLKIDCFLFTICSSSIPFCGC